MKAKTVSVQTQGVQRRFFEAIDLLVAQGKLAGLQTFCDEHGLHRAKYSNLRSGLRKTEHDSRYRLIDIDALIYIVKNYGIGAEWLLTGNGKMLV